MPGNETGVAMPASTDTRNAARMRSGWVALSVLVTLAIITDCLQRYGLSTLAVHHEAVRSWLSGGELYAYRAPGSQAGAALPPAMAILLAPLALLPLCLAGGLLAVAGVAAVLLAIRVVAGPIAQRHGSRRLPFVFVIAALALLTEPVRAAIGQGRPEPLILALLAADLVALRHAACLRATGPLRDSHPMDRRVSRRFRDSHPIDRRVSRPFRDSHPLNNRAYRPFRNSDPMDGRVSGPFRDSHAMDRRSGIAVAGPLRRALTSGSWAGAGIGLATAVSVTPVLFIVYLLITRQRRAALTALGTAAAVTLAALAAAPSETLAWFGATMWELDRPAPISGLDNQSLAGMLARLHDCPAPPVLVWFSFSALLVAVGLIRSRSARTDGDEVAAFTLIGLTTAVAGPVTTAPDSLWLIPALLIMADTGLRRRLDGRAARRARIIGTIYLVAAVGGYLALLGTPEWALRWNIPALILILLVNSLPWRHGSPARPTTLTVPRRAVIPLPRLPRVRGS